MAKPPGMPPISDERSTVDWFLKYDEKLASVRSSPALADQTRQDILEDLRSCRDGASLKEHLDRMRETYAVLLPEADKRKEAGGPLPGEDRRKYLGVLLKEAILAAKIRVLGYFLIRKYGLTPD